MNDKFKPSMGPIPQPNMVGPKGNRILNLISYLRNPVLKHFEFAKLAEEKQVPLVSTSEGDATMLIVFSHEGMKQLSINKDETWIRPEAGALSVEYGSKSYIATRGISSTNGLEWLEKRRAASKGFRPAEMIVKFNQKMVEVAQEQKNIILGNKELNLRSFGIDVAMKNAWPLIFGHVPTEEQQNFVNKNVDKVLNGAINPFAALLQWNNIVTPYGRWIRACENLYDWAEKTALETMKSSSNSVYGVILDSSSDKDILKVLGEAVVLYVTSRDGPGAALSWTLFLLATHPKIQFKLIEEIHKNNDSYLEAVINESLRVLPASFVLNPRKTTKNVIIDGVEVPENSNVFGSVIHRHRNPNIWNNPNIFNPNRWLESNFKPSPYDFMPFGQGSRRCIGDQFSMLMLKNTLKILLKSCWFEIDNKSKYNVDINAVLMQPDKKSKLLVKSNHLVNVNKLTDIVKINGNITDYLMPQLK